MSQAIPLGFFIEAVPAIGRELGLSLRDIGLIQALALPFLIKFLWAPVVDGFGSARLGHYRSWLLPLQGLAAATVLAMAWLDPERQVGTLLALGALFLLLAATQDIATDGLAVRVLDRGERGIGNGIQVGGFYLGQILGGGLTLVLFARYGWRPALLVIAAWMAVPLVALLGRFGALESPGPGGLDPDSRPVAPRVDFAALGRFFRRPGMGVWVLVLVIYRAGDAMAVTMAKQLFVDLGLSLVQIGAIVGLGNSVAALLGALVGGAAVGRIGRKRSLAGFAAVHGVAVLTLALPATGFASLPVVWTVSILVAFAGGMATAVLYTCMMDRAEPATGGTDFTLQQSLAVVGPLLGAGLSGLSAEALGFAGHFGLCAAVSFGVAALIASRMREG